MIFQPCLASVCSPTIALSSSVYHFSPCVKTDISMSAVSVQEVVVLHNWSFLLTTRLSTVQCAVHSKNTMILRKLKVTFNIITPTTLHLQPLLRMVLQSVNVQVIMSTAKMTMHWNLLKVKKLIGIVSAHMWQCCWSLQTPQCQSDVWTSTWPGQKENQKTLWQTITLWMK